MRTQFRFLFFTLILTISFAAVNAVLFSPGLPNIADFFTVSQNTAQHTMLWFIVGYALGQLVYGPLANRFGRKPALYIGISIQIISSLLCAASSYLNDFSILLIGRFLLALGSGVGLKMGFTLVNEYYDAKIASQKTAYLMLAFAIAPGLSVTLGGILNSHFGWTSCFYASAVYGTILFLLTSRLPETKTALDYDALRLSHLLKEYNLQFKNSRLVVGGLMMGCATSFIYVFSALAPFIVINLFGMNSTEYGFTNLLPQIGLVLGLLSSAQLVKKYSHEFNIKIGVMIASIGVLLMLLAIMLQLPVIVSIFFTTLMINYGLSLILSNSSSFAMSSTTDKAHGSAVMNFLNMGTATIMVLVLSLFKIKPLLLPSIFLAICAIMFFLHRKIAQKTKL